MEVSGTAHNTRPQTQRHISLSDWATVVKTSKENKRKGFHMKGFEDKREEEIEFQKGWAARHTPGFSRWLCYLLDASSVSMGFCLAECQLWPS